LDIARCVICCRGVYSRPSVKERRADGEESKRRRGKREERIVLKISECLTVGGSKRITKSINLNESRKKRKNAGFLSSHQNWNGLEKSRRNQAPHLVPCRAGLRRKTKRTAAMMSIQETRAKRMGDGASDRQAGSGVYFIQPDWKEMHREKKNSKGMVLGKLLATLQEGWRTDQEIFSGGKRDLRLGRGKKTSNRVRRKGQPQWEREIRSLG